MKDLVPGGQPFEVFNTMAEFFRAVLEVWTAMEDEGNKPGSEKWTVHADPSEDLYRRVQMRWSELTDFESWMMPYTQDALKAAWIGIRKLDNKEFDAFRQRAGVGIFGAALPADSKLFRNGAPK